MTTPAPPSTIRAWQYSNSKGGLENAIKLNSSAALPKPKPNQHLVQIIAAALNPVDYKPAEVPFVTRLAISKPATPGIDFAGLIITPASGSLLRPGQLVFGMSGTSPLAGGALSEYSLADEEHAVPVPEGVHPVDAATVGVAGLSAYQSILPYVKAGDSVFINGGSGGVGVFGIQIAKVAGCQVTTSCSTVNVDLCKSLGADEVVDYKKQSVMEALKSTGHKFDHIVDNVGSDPDLYWNCHEYTKPGAIYMMVGGTPTFRAMWDRTLMRLWPGFLGGGQRKLAGMFAKGNYSELDQIGTWMKEGKVKAVIDQRFPFEQAPKAIEKLKTGRAKGKIVVEVSPEAAKTK